MLVSLLLTAHALAQTPCTWEASALPQTQLELSTRSDGGSGAPLPFKMDTWKDRAGPRARATLRLDGAMDLELVDETIRVNAVAPRGVPVLSPTAPLELGAGLLVTEVGRVSVQGVEGAGVRVTALIANYVPVSDPSAVLPCDHLSLSKAKSTVTRSEVVGELVTGAHVLRATPGGEPLGTLTREPQRWEWTIVTGERKDGHVLVEVWQSGLRLRGWLPASAVEGPSGVLGGLLGGMREGGATTSYLACGAGAVSLVAQDGASSALGELIPGAIVEVVGKAGDHQTVRLPGAAWIQPGSSQLAMRSEAIAACTPASAEAVAAVTSNSTGLSSGIGGLIGYKGAPPTAGGERGGSRVGGEPLIVGALDKQLIDAVIERNLNKIQHCYQRELKDNPKLTGKIMVKFVITGDGAVSKAETKFTTMNNANVESCINDRFMKFQFPDPKGGSIVIVSYPFVFSPG